MPPPIQNVYLDDDLPLAEPVLRTWMRCLLVAVVFMLLVVFGVAIYLKPYGDDGAALRWETHRQLGLPECNFKGLTGRPCPACGMTTSFSLLVRGDLVNSARANFVGTLLAAVCMLFVPWGLASALRARYYWIHSLEWYLPRFAILFVVLMLVRWAAVFFLD